MSQGMWDLPGSGIEPVSPALAGRFFTTEPPGKPAHCSWRKPAHSNEDQAQPQINISRGEKSAYVNQKVYTQEYS